MTCSVVGRRTGGTFHRWMSWICSRQKFVLYRWLEFLPKHTVLSGVLTISMSCWGSEEVRITCTSMAGAQNWMMRPFAGTPYTWGFYQPLCPDVSRILISLKPIHGFDVIWYLESWWTISIRSIRSHVYRSFMVIQLSPKWSPKKSTTVTHWYSVRQWVDRGVDPPSCDLRRASWVGGKNVGDWDLHSVLRLLGVS